MFTSISAGVGNLPCFHTFFVIELKISNFSVSFSTIVLYSRNHKRVGVAHEIISPKNQPQFSQMTMRQYWLGKTKPKQAFRSTRKTFNKLLRIFFLII